MVQVPEHGIHLDCQNPIMKPAGRAVGRTPLGRNGFEPVDVCTLSPKPHTTGRWPKLHIDHFRAHVYVFGARPSSVPIGGSRISPARLPEPPYDHNARSKTKT